MVWRWLQQQFGTGRPAEPSVSISDAALPKDSVDLLQFSASPTGRTIDVVIGFDFGTSCAKVAVQTPYELGARTLLVPFGDLGYKSCAYVLPASVYRDDAGQWYLSPPRARFVEHRAHLKLPLLGEIRSGHAPDSDSTTAAVAFMALGLRSVRHYFLSSQSAVFGRAPLSWALNVGVPSAGYDDGAIRERFGVVARIAWLVSLSPAISSQQIQAHLAKQVPPALDDVPVSVVPEVAAEMVGYARSKFRRPGLHTVFDVGASTLDVCGIDLFDREGEDNYELLTADVRDLGLLELQARRRRICQVSSQSQKGLEDIVGPMNAPTPQSQEVELELKRCDEEYVEDAAKIVIRTLAWLKLRRAPEAPAWRDGLPLFVTGGAAHAPIIEAIVRRVHTKADSIWVNYNGIRRQPLPMEFAEGPKAGDPVLSRMAVAYGLSFPAINIGKIVPPHEIPDVYPELRRRRDWQHAYVSKEAV
jgi:hypothetical protein